MVPRRVGAQICLFAAPDMVGLAHFGSVPLAGSDCVNPLLIGSLILFNQAIVDWLLLSPGIVSRWTGASDEELDASRAATMSRLYLTYFGLCFLGVGSFLFAILCPTEAKRFDTVSEYISAEKPLITKPRTGILVSLVAEDYLRNHGEDHAVGPQLLRQAAYTFPQVELFSSVITEITEEIEWNEGEPDANIGVACRMETLTSTG